MQVFIMGGSNPASILEEITATPAQVLEGYTFNDSEGEKQTGTMPTYTIDTSVAVDGTYTNTTPGYYTNITVKGPTLSGNAAASNVLTGKTFYSDSGTKQTGTMADQGAVDTSVSVGGSYTGSAGYYSSIKVAGPTLSGNATAGQVLTGKTFYNNSGTIRTGTMNNCGKLTAGINVFNKTAKQWSNHPDGYYSSINIAANHYIRYTSFTLNGCFINSKIPTPASGRYGARMSTGASSSFKIFESGGYLWLSRNQGSNGTVYVYSIETV